MVLATRGSSAVQGVLIGIACIAAATAAIAGLQHFAPASSFGGLYALAILPLALTWGFRAALAGAIGSAVVFDYFFFDPTFALPIEDTDDAVIVSTSGAIAYVVSALASRVRQRAEDAAALAREQSALRSVATEVARGGPAEEVFARVTAEAGRLLRCDMTAMCRYDDTAEMTVVGLWTAPTQPASVSVGDEISPHPASAAALVREGGHSARLDRQGTDGLQDASGLDAGDVRSAVGAPISLEGRLWGAMIAVARNTSLPPDTETRVTGFTELIATAVANAEAQTQLAVSRARVVATADATRRHIERNLHDGAQQRLVSCALQLRAAQAAAPPDAGDLRERLNVVADELTSAIDDLREIARGIHPAVLAEGGLRPALKALSRRSPIPVRLDVHVDSRLPEHIEVAAYYVVAESLTNAAKHAHASIVDVDARTANRVLTVQVRDDGRGGATLTGGSGLLGLKDRIEALGGRFSLHSPQGEGTRIDVALPTDATNG